MLFGRVFCFRILLLFVFLTVETGAIELLYGVTTVAHAKRKKIKKSKKNKKGKRDKRGKSAGKIRTIKREKDLAPKEDVALDTNISKTEDLKIVAEQSAGPTLTPEQLEVQQNEASVDEKLDEEIEIASQLELYETGCDGLSPVRARLADLYWQKSKREFFKSNANDINKRQKNAHEALMKKLQKQTVDKYKQVLSECAAYKDYPDVLLRLGKTLVELDRTSEAIEHFLAVIESYPEHPIAPQAHFMVGEYYFNDKGNARKALKAYKLASTDTTTMVYPFAIYKMGWCRVNTGDWDLAMAQFQKTIQLMDDPSSPLDPKGRKTLRKEAVKDYVRSFSNLGDAKNAIADFTHAAGKKSLHKMMELLGNWYVSRDAHRDVITVYRSVIDLNKQSTRLAIYQGRIVNAMKHLGADNKVLPEVRKLTHYFSSLRRRQRESHNWSAKKLRAVKRDIKEAENIAENTLRGMAMDFHKDAKKLMGRSQRQRYRLANDLYSHYLKVFPEPIIGADVNYVFYMRYYHAEVLYFLEDFQGAADSYEKVLEMSIPADDKKMNLVAVRAAEDVVRALVEVVRDYDHANKLVIDGTEEKTIPKVKQQLIAACERYIERAGNSGSRIVEIRYKVARIYYSYNYFTQAAPVFNEIVTNHPRNEAACYSANLALDIYNGQKDYISLRKKAREYRKDSRLACEQSDRDKFRKVEEQATFFVIKNLLEERKKYIAAADGYMKFFKQYGKPDQSGKRSNLALDAVYNAAVNYDLGQRLDKANEARKFLVQTFPADNKLVKETLYNIAQSFERVADFRKAAAGFDAFAARYPSDKRTKDAVFNAGLYRATLHDYVGSRRARVKYVKSFKKAKDRHKVAFQICETFEREAEQLTEAGASNKRVVDTWVLAHDCYMNWADSKKNVFSKKDTDLTCVAALRRAEIMRTKTKYDKGYRSVRKKLLKNWPKWKKKGVDKVPRCAAGISKILVRAMDSMLPAYRAMKVSEVNPANEKYYVKSIKAIVKERDRLIKGYKEIVKIGVADWALAGLSRIGDLQRQAMEAVQQAPIPNNIKGLGKVPEDIKIELRKRRDGDAIPARDSAVEAYKYCVDKAHELGIYNKWSLSSLAQLQKLVPEQYRPVRERIPKIKFEVPFRVLGNGIVTAEKKRFVAITQTLTGEYPKPTPKKIPMTNSLQKSTLEGEPKDTDMKQKGAKQ